MPFELNWQTDKKVAKFIETSSFLADPLLKVEEALNKYTDITPNSTWQDINNHIISLHKKLSHPNTRTELTKQLTGITRKSRDSLLKENISDSSIAATCWSKALPSGLRPFCRGGKG